MNAQTEIIERDGWKVTLDLNHYMVRMGLALGDQADWIGWALELLETFTAQGMSESDALAKMNEGGSWALFERTEGK